MLKIQKREDLQGEILEFIKWGKVSICEGGNKGRKEKF